MSANRRTGVEEARSQLPQILQQAEKGQSTIITRHGRAVAAIVPLAVYESGNRQESLISAAGSGRGLWGRASAATIRQLRDEWSR